MKRNIILFCTLLILPLLITGCGNKDADPNKRVCTITTMDDDGYKTNDTITLTIKDNIVTKVEDVSISEADPKYIDTTISFSQEIADLLSEVDGLELSYNKEGYNKIKMTMSLDYTLIDDEQVREVLGDAYDDKDSYFDKKNITVDDFISEYLDEYKCK